MSAALPRSVRRRARRLVNRPGVRRALRMTPRDPHARRAADLLHAHRRDVRGRVLEIGTTSLVRDPWRRVTSVDLADEDPYQPAVTFLVAPAEADVLDAGAYDCVLIDLVGRDEVADAIRDHAWRALADGGVLLAIVADGDGARCERTTKGRA